MYQKKDNRYLTSCAVDEEGNYVFYLESGDYSVQVSKADATIIAEEEVSVTNASVIQDFDITSAS